MAARTYRRRLAGGDDDAEEAGGPADPVGSNGSRRSNGSPNSMRLSTRTFDAPAAGAREGAAGGISQTVPVQANGQKLRKGRGSVPPAAQKQRKSSLNRLERDLREEIDAW